jgi:hypothetical protein
MTYEQFVIDVFKEDQNCKGMDMEEIEDIITETPFKQIEKFLTKSGYDLNDMYYMDYGRV